MLEVQKSTLDMAGVDRLEQIRASMAGEKLAGKPQAPAVEQAPTAAGMTKEASVARLDEIRASLANKDQQPSGDSTAAS